MKLISCRGVDWKKTGHKDELLKAFERFGPGVQQILELAPEEKLMCWDLQDMEELPKWTQQYVALVGDAAHPLLPCKLHLNKGLTKSVLTGGTFSLRAGGSDGRRGRTIFGSRIISRG